MPLSEEYIKELFSSDAFKEAVKDYLKENLQVNVKVTNGDDFYQKDNVVKVEVELNLADDQDRITRTSYFTSSSDSVSVRPVDDSNPW
jgi:gluconate kinase